MALEIFYGDLCDNNALISSHPQDETKSLEVLGIIYRYFHKFFTPATLLCLYISFVWPTLEYLPQCGPPSQSLLLTPLNLQKPLLLSSKFGKLLFTPTSQN